MTSEFHKEELLKLRHFLMFNDRDLSYAQADEITPYDRIVIKLYAEMNGQTVFWPVELAFIPGLEKDLRAFSILQCYVPAVTGIAANKQDELAAMTTRINPKLAIGSFGLLPSLQLLFYKHNTLFLDTQIEPGHSAIQEMLSMIAYLLANFQEAFVNVATGKETVEQAMATMPFSSVYQ